MRNHEDTYERGKVPVPKELPSLMGEVRAHKKLTPGRPKRASRKGRKLVRTKFRVVNHSLLGCSKLKGFLFVF